VCDEIRFVAWKYILKPKATKWDKLPINPHTGKAASVSGPETWGTFAEALACMKRHRLAGVGIILTHLSKHPKGGKITRIAGGDLDDCITDSGSLTPLAAVVLAYAETYAECSPSATGIKMLFTDEIARAVKDSGIGVEIYGDGRFFTITGQNWEGTPTEIRPAPRTVAKLTATVEAAREEMRTKTNGAHTNGYANGHTHNGHERHTSAGDDFFSKVKAAALANLDKWVPTLHPTAKKQATGGWSISSEAFDRNLQERLSYHSSGITDFGEERGLTPIDAVLKYGNVAGPTEAAFWLCKQLGVEPASLGWRGVTATMQTGTIGWPEVTKKGMAVDRSQANIRHFLKASGVVLSFNAFTEQPSITVNGVTRALNDEVVARLRMAMHREGLNPSESFFEVALLDLALENSWHPVREYLAGLKWDGVLRLDTWLTTYLGAEDTKLHQAWGRCHLLAAVKRIMSPGAKHDAILVFEGDQGIGKSRAIAILAGPYFTDALKVGLDSKEVIELTDGCWLAEYPELEGITGREMSSVKAQLSRCSDRARLAYGRSTTERHRQWVAFGTVNERSYLRDHTGNRRFWTVEVTRIDLARLTQDRDQIWAEAYYRLGQGETHELPESLYAAAAEAQSKRVLETPWEMRLAPTLEDVYGRLDVEALFEFLGIAAHRQDGFVGAQLNRTMVKLGWRKTQQRRDKRQTHCYERKPPSGQSHWLRYDHVTRGWVKS
jgi:hypothetical protein